LIGVVWWGRRSDKHQERYGHAAIASFLGGLGLLLSVLLHDPSARVAALALALTGTLSFAPVFWTIPPSFLSGAAAAGGLAAISALGILGGFLSPWFVGYMKDHTGDFRYGLGSVACFGMVMAIALYLVGRQRERGASPAPANRRSAAPAE
jgi:nitrate/nitrite transporter NarK